jgi:hypothetical protein
MTHNAKNFAANFFPNFHVNDAADFDADKRRNLLRSDGERA